MPGAVLKQKGGRRWWETQRVHEVRESCNHRLQDENQSINFLFLPFIPTFDEMLVFFFSSKKDDEDEREEKKKKNTSSSLDKTIGPVMLESLKPISPGWWWVRTCAAALAPSQHPWRWAGRISLLNCGGNSFFFPLCVPHSSTCENRIVFCLRNVYVWTSVLSLDKSIEKEKKIFPFSHSYSFFFLQCSNYWERPVL